MNSTNFTVPDELYYSKSHEWAQIDENLVTVGLTDFRLNQMGEVLYLDLPEEGKNVTHGEDFFSLESVKEIHDFVSPVTGTIIEINYSIFDNPGLLNDDPYNSGWIVKIEMDNINDLATLMRAEEYKKQIGMPTSKIQRPVVEEPIDDHPLEDESDDDDDDDSDE